MLIATAATDPLTPAQRAEIAGCLAAMRTARGNIRRVEYTKAFRSARAYRSACLEMLSSALKDWRILRVYKECGSAWAEEREHAVNCARAALEARTEYHEARNALAAYDARKGR